MAVQDINCNLKNMLEALSTKVDSVYTDGESLDFAGEYNESLGSLSGIAPASDENVDFGSSYEDEVDTSSIAPSSSGS